MPRTLITGGAGFIGLHLGRALLERGHEITLLDNFARGVVDPELEQVRAQPRVCFLERDLTQPGGLEGEYDHIVHLAAIVGVDIVRSRPYDVLALNHAMLERVIGFARAQKGLRRLLFASTSEVYAGTLRYFGMPVPTPESTPLTLHDLAEPRTSYMLSKVHGEAMCRYSGVPWSVIRVHNAYGPRMGLSHVVPQLLRKANALLPGGKLEVYSPRHRRSFCYISDVTELIARILETPGCEGETLNVGSQGPEVAMEEVGRLVLQTVGKTAGVEPMPDAPGSPPRRAPDMTRTTRLTGYAAQTDLPSGLARCWAWYRNVFEGAFISAL
jgi:nucleoside-diphosphate-sugar epimerase